MYVTFNCIVSNVIQSAECSIYRFSVHLFVCFLSLVGLYH